MADNNDPISQAIEKMIAQKMVNSMGGGVTPPSVQTLQMRQQAAQQQQSQNANFDYLGASPEEFASQIANLPAGVGQNLAMQRNNFQTSQALAQRTAPLVNDIDRTMLQTNEDGSPIYDAQGNPQLREGFGQTVGQIQGRLTDTPVVGGLLQIGSDLTSDGTASSGNATREQLLAKNYQEAYESLRGGGSITEYEGKTIAAALNRLSNNNVSNEEYARELMKVRNLMELGVFRSQNGIINQNGKDIMRQDDGTYKPVTLYRNPQTNTLELIQDKSLPVIDDNLTPSQKKLMFQKIKSGEQYIYKGKTVTKK